MSDRLPAPPGWAPTHAHGRSVAVGVSLLVVALVTGRADLLVLGAPLAIVAFWTALSRPVGTPDVTAPVVRLSVREGEPALWRASVSTVPGMRGLVAVHPGDRWLELEPESGMVTTAAGPGTTHLDVVLSSTRWGRRTLGAPQVAAYSDWNAWRWGPLPLPQVTVTTLPATAPFDSAAPAPHPRGLVGMNRADRVGEGSEFAKVRPFQAGDRLRRIHWPVSARTGQLHVTATYADEDSQVIVLVDAFNDIGDSQGVTGRHSSMDVTVRAASAVVEHHLRRGDRVGIRVFGSRHGGRTPVSSGRNQLRRVLDTLALIEPGTLRDDDGLSARQGLHAGTLVIAMSPLVDTAALQQVVSLSRHGLTVVVVDTLPDDVAEGFSADDADGARALLAWRIRMLERRLEIGRIAALGIPVVPWVGPGSLDQVLRGLAQRRGAPRVVPR